MIICQPESNEKEISLCVQAAIAKLDWVDADAKGKKSQIVQDLAKDLERKIPTEGICNEIVHQLRHKVSERLIRSCLDEKYKEKHRVDNAKKQKKKHQITEDLAAPAPLNIQQEKKKIVIDTSGNEVSDLQPSIIKGTDDKDEELITQSNRRDAKECNNCKIKDSKIEELEDVVRKITQLKPADQIAKTDNKTNESDNAEASVKPHDEANENKERTANAESTLTHSLNDDITAVSRQKEYLTDKQKEILISHIPMRFEDLRKDMAAVFQITKGVGNVFFKIWVDLGTHVIRIKFSGITQENGIAMTSIGEGRMLKEAN